MRPKEKERRPGHFLEGKDSTRTYQPKQGAHNGNWIRKKLQNQAANHGVENARLNGLNNVRYEPISVEAWLKYKSAEAPRPDFALLDPPRADAGVQVIERLAAMGPPALAYVSCDPATLARDLRLLVDYGYQIASITALDMFPQTFHVETVVRLRNAVQYREP